MIPITPAIMGPGIEEEYEDLLERIDKLQILLKPFPASNDTREGRLVYLLAWLRQEINAQRLPVPLDRKYWGTLAYLIGEGSLDHLGGEKAMGEIATILDGEGILKPRHWPVVVAMLDEFLAYIQLHLPNIGPLDRFETSFLNETRQIRDDLVAGRIVLPLDKALYAGWARSSVTDHLHSIPNFSNRRRSILLSVFANVRPKACQKSPLPAPNPGMVWGTDS